MRPKITVPKQLALWWFDHWVDVLTVVMCVQVAAMLVVVLVLAFGPFLPHP